MSLTKEELIETVKKLTAGEYATEEEGDTMLKAIRSSVPHPRVANVLLYSRGKNSGADGGRASVVSTGRDAPASRVQLVK